MSDALAGAIVGAVIAAGASVLIFAVTQIISLVQRIRAARRARVEAVLSALSAIILELRGPQIFLYWSNTQILLRLAVIELVGALPRRDRSLVDFLWYTSHRLGNQPRLRRVELATDGIAAIRVWLGSKGNGRRYMTARLIGTKQESLFGAKLYNKKLPCGVHRPRKFHRPLETRPET